MQRGILFDLDGTLIKSAFAPAETKAAVLKRLEELGVDTKDLPPTLTMMEILDRVRARLQDGGAIAPDKVEQEIGDALDQSDFSLFSSAKLQDDVEYVLDSLASKGLKLGIVTNSGRKPVDALLKRVGLAHFFSAVITRNDVQSLKPSKEGVVKGMQIMGCNPASTAYVGDSWIDIKAAKDAGVKAIAMAGGISSLERLQHESPDVLITTLRDLLALY